MSLSRWLIFFSLIIVIAAASIFFYINNLSSSDIIDVKYARDGEHIFYVDSRSIFIDMPLSKLFYATTSQENKKELYECPFIHELLVSPTGNYIMFLRDMPDLNTKLIILNTQSFKIVEETNFKVPYPMYLGWHPKDDKIYFTDSDGICLYDLKTSRKESLIRDKQCYLLNWSKEGKYFVYKTDSSRFGGNSIFLFDYNKKTKMLLSSETSGLFEHALIDEKNKSIFYSFILKKDNSADIGSIDINNLTKNKIWSMKATDKDEPVWIFKLMFADHKKSLLFDIKAGTLNEKEDGIYQFQLDNKKIKKLISFRDISGHVPWDYSLKINKIIYFDRDSNTLKEKELP